MLSSLLHAVEARGHALSGDTHATRTAVLEAERQYDRARPAEEPTWLSFYTEAELSADLGRCLRDAGEPEHGTRMIKQALDTYEPWRVRSRCFVQTDLATAHLANRDLEHATALGRDALRTATVIHVMSSVFLCYAGVVAILLSGVRVQRARYRQPYRRLRPCGNRFAQLSRKSDGISSNSTSASTNTRRITSTCVEST